MEISSIDLRTYQCPMALLLAKRACEQLDWGDKLKMILADPASAQDIYHFLTQKQFAVDTEKADKTTIFHIEKLKR